MSVRFYKPRVFDYTNMTTNVPVTSTPNWNKDTTYAIGNTVFDPLSNHEYRSVKDANKGHAFTDADVKTWWQDLGVQNALKAFDKYPGSRTTNPNMIEYILDPKKYLDTLVILNTNAVRIELYQYEIVNGVEVKRFEAVKRMVKPSGSSWFNWHFDEIQSDTSAIFVGLPAYSQAKLRIRLYVPGGVASVGLIAFGRATLLGPAAYGASVGIQDYSPKVRDAYGSFEVVEGQYSDINKFQVQCSDDMVDRIKEILIPYRATACIYIGEPSLRSTICYGYYSSFDNILSRYGQSDCNLNIEGLASV